MKPVRFLISAMLLLLVSLQIQASAGVHSWAEKSALSEGYWVKVALDSNNDGIYQISYSKLREWGFSSPEKVGVYGFGGHELSESFASGHIDDLPEIAIYHDTKNKRILFYGQGVLGWKYKNSTDGYVHRWNGYSDKAYYFLHEVSESPKELQAAEAVAYSGQPTISTFDEHLVYEKNNINIGETGREFYGESFTTTAVQSFTPSLHGSSSSSGRTILEGTGLLTLNFVAYCSASCQVKATINGMEAGSVSINAVTASYTFANEGILNAKLSSFSDLTDAPIKLTFSTSDKSVKEARLNYIRLQGKCALDASEKEGYMLFRSSEAQEKQVQYEVGSLTQQMQIWDVTDPTQALLVSADDEGHFIPSETGIREYAVVNPANTGNFPTVAFVEKVANQNLHGTAGANLVIVTAPGYMEYAQKLADFRQSNDQLSTLIVTPEQIYNEYSSGTPDATAIRLFMKQMYDRQQSGQLDASNQLRYLLLFGDGSFENRKNALSNYQLLTYQSEASLKETISCTCDDYFGFLDDREGGRTNEKGQYTIASDVMDIGIGRLPVSSSLEAESLVNKIITYSQNHYYGAWKNRMVFLSDDDKDDTSGHDSPNLHISHNEQLVNSMLKKGHHEFVYQKIYLPAYQQTTSASGTEYADARKELLESLQQGTMIVHYAGHGSANNITHEQLMNTATASELRMKNLPLWILASCDVARWDASSNSMGEALLLNDNGGSVAVIGAARVVYAANNLTLHQGIVDHLFDKNSDGTRFRLGDIFKAAKKQVGTEFNKLNYALLGDPSMMLAFPKQSIEVDEVTYSDQITISGRVLQEGTQLTDTLFNGLIYPTIYGDEEKITADKGFWQEPAYTFASRTKKVFSGRDVIQKGRFEFSFTIPVDAAASNDALINLYACSEDGNEGDGYYRNLQITPNTSGTTDEEGPTIKAIFLDSQSFQSGDRVGATPFFYAEVYDANGFNTTGNSIGHDIVLNIRCLSNTILKPQQYVLNNYFTTFTGDACSGNIKYSLSQMEEGRYEATFRIWDAYNNPTSQTFEFEVCYTEEPAIELVQAYPSPAKQGSEVIFRVMHNRPESADEMHIQIYTQMGVKVLDKVVTSSAAEVVYLTDGAKSKSDISKAMNADETSQLMGCSTTTWKATVAPGIYMYRVYLKSGKGEASSESKKIIIF